MKIKVKTILEEHDVEANVGDYIELGDITKKEPPFIGILVKSTEEIELIVNPFKFKKKKIGRNSKISLASAIE